MPAEDDVHKLEVVQAQRLVRWITGEDCQLKDIPDAPGKQTKPGGNADAVLKDAAGDCYVVEVGRLLTPEVRELEHFVDERIAEPLQGRIPGTFTLNVDHSKLRRGRLTRDKVNSVLQEINNLIDSGKLVDEQALSGDLVLVKVRNEGSRVVPWITGPSVAYDAREDDPDVANLREHFRRQVAEADRKLEGCSGHRILLMDIGQSGLDDEFHAQRFKDSQGILLTWADMFCSQAQNLDHVFLEPGVQVFQSSSGAGRGPQIYAGTKWVDKPSGFYVPLWRSPNRPPIGRFRL